MMMTQKHTPGPWEVIYTGVCPLIRTKDADGAAQKARLDAGKPIREIALISPLHGEISNPSERDANAALIAAAPDLLEALKVARNAIKELPEWLELKEQVNSAIAKAEGK